MRARAKTGSAGMRARAQESPVTSASEVEVFLTHYVETLESRDEAVVRSRQSWAWGWRC